MSFREKLHRRREDRAKARIASVKPVKVASVKPVKVASAKPDKDFPAVESL